MSNPYLESKLQSYLARRSAPRGMSEPAQVEEVAALVRAVSRLAPDAGVNDWWARMEDALDRALVTRAWPTVKELSDASRQVTTPNQFGEGRGDRRKLTFDQLRKLEEHILPTARRWMDIPGLSEHGEKTLAFWGETPTVKGMGA